MSYKILEANGVDNENIDGGALNNLIVKDKNGIVNGVLSECALTATGSLIGISPGLLILHGIRVKITETETLTLANVPATATKYQIVAQVVLSADRSISFSFLVQEPTALKQDELYATNEGTYQIEFGTLTQNTDGTISALARTLGTLYESETQMREDLNGALADIVTLKTAVDGNEKGIAENTTLIANNARNINKNAAHIQNLFSIARANNQFAVLKTEQAYTTRQTANGAEIFDEQHTAITEIKGSTVNSINKYNLTEAKNDTNPGAGTKITVLENGFLVVGKESDIPYKSDYANGWFRAGGNMFKALPIVRTGDKLNVSVDITLVEDENKLSLDEAFAQYPNAGKIGAFFYDNSGNQAGGHITLSLSNTTAKQTKTFSCTVPEAMNGKVPYLVINLNSFTMKIENIMVTINEDLPSSFVPYFTDLKHANISAIKSTGRNLFDLNLLGSWLTKDSTDENYFVFAGGTTDLFKLFDEPKNIYAKIKYKAYNTTRPANERGAFPMFIRNDGTKFELSTYLNRDGETSAHIENVVGMKFTFGSYHKNTIGEFIISFEDVPFEPYTEDIYELLQELIALYPNGIPEYDRFYPQTGELIRQTGYATSETGFTEEEIASYDGAIVSGDNLSLEYKLATPTIEKIENSPKLYKACRHGSETVIQGETDNSVFGAMPTITNEYFAAVGAGEEEANE